MEHSSTPQKSVTAIAPGCSDVVLQRRRSRVEKRRLVLTAQGSERDGAGACGTNTCAAGT
jgi:hypothetical protein